MFALLDPDIVTDDECVARLVAEHGVVVIPMYDFYPVDARERLVEQLTPGFGGASFGDDRIDVQAAMIAKVDFVHPSLAFAVTAVAVSAAWGAERFGADSYGWSDADGRRINVLHPNPQSIFDGLQVGFVNVSTGNLTFERRDMVVPGRRRGLSRPLPVRDRRHFVLN